MSKSIKEAKYQEIALRIAKRINNGELRVGEKLRGRSILSSEYNVSSETIRKAIRLLANHGVVEVKERSGIFVISIAAAQAYIKKHLQEKRDKDLYNEIMVLFEQQKETQKDISDKVRKFATISGQREFNHFPFQYFHITIQALCPYINTSIKSIPLWEHTKGTIIAIEKDGNFIPSPNPNTKLSENNILYVLGDENVYKNTLFFLTKPDLS
ncbi:GntR family transcriptional regulator [Haloplasma contractile]|uniref:Exu regulon transcriptional regulator protein n=1 Tax=Haloplasma contractile SSD-17B TaxID=1033810 RepID=U2FQ06_9MOLU|nr:GntR family transcriptional regulator [Haloplasma contractile]ERJ13129.1 Exu regulon transcriptional regulator protein [Haloplasma contractile SSD-17B]